MKDKTTSSSSLSSSDNLNRHLATDLGVNSNMLFNIDEINYLRQHAVNKADGDAMDGLLNELINFRANPFVNALLSDGKYIVSYVVLFQS